MFKFKKYRVHRFAPSPVLVLDKFPHGENKVANQNLKKLHCCHISQEIIYFNYLLPSFKLPKESATLIFFWGKSCKLATLLLAH
jgi:hypothetical protein